MAADVIHIHGNLSKLEKFKFVQIFCERIGVPELLPRVLVGTNSVELSVDHPHVHHVTFLEWQDGVALFDQKRGRVGRKGEPSKVSVVAGIVSLISLQRRNHVQRHTPIQKEDDNTATQSIFGRNTNIRSSSKRISKYDNNLESQFKLGTTQQSNYFGSKQINNSIQSD